MEFFLANPNIERLPPVNTRLVDLCVKPYPAGKRLRVALDLTPCQQKPYLDLILTDVNGEVIAETSIVEPVTGILELTLNIPNRSTTASGVYNLRVNLSFPDLGEFDHRNLFIEIPSPMV
jgi:hypothetical protein